MKKAKNDKLGWWTTHAVVVYRYMLIVFVFLVLAYAGSTLTTVSAALPGQTEFGSFNSQICAMVTTAGRIVGGLALLMVMSAGIMYALSGGEGKGDLSIGAAKGMITSAITGVILYLMGSLLLGKCGEYSGGLLRQWINPAPAPTSWELVIDRQA